MGNQKILDYNLIKITKNNNIKTLKSLLKDNVDVNVKDSLGNTPLILAVKNNNIKIVKLLLKSTANPNIQNYNGHTALMWSMWIKNEDIRKLLLEYNASSIPMVPDKYKYIGIFGCLIGLSVCLTAPLFLNK